MLPTPLPPQHVVRRRESEGPHFSNFPPPTTRFPKGAWCPGLKMPQPNPCSSPLPELPCLHKPPVCLAGGAWEDGDAKGLGRGLIISCGAANRPSSATSYYSAAPPQPPSLASLRLSAAPGTRHQIGVKIPRVSFAAVDGADNRDRLAGGSGGAEADSLLRLPPSALQQAGGRPEPALGRRGRESSVMGWAACLCCCLLHQCRPGIGRQLKAWAVMGSEDAKSQEAGGGQMGSPSPRLCHTVPGESACFHPTSLPGTQSPCC